MNKKTFNNSSITYPIIEEKLPMKSDPEFSIPYTLKKETKKTFKKKASS